MSDYSNSRKKSDSSNYKTGRKDTNKGKSWSRFGNRPTGKKGFPSIRSGGPKQRVFKKFDPSVFMKKVEEQVTSAAYVPKHLFSDFLIEEQIKKNIIEKGYKAPTPIQDQVIPLLLEGKDVVATANTGTGKTAAFLIPLVHNILTKKTSRVLIIAPTRELAIQINQELKDFKKNTAIASTLCIGGASLGVQMHELRRNPQFVIGTTGRLLDLERNNAIHFNSFTTIVLDEVDTMLDMGFINDIKQIVAGLPAKRHSLFFSATIPKKLHELMQTFLKNPIAVSVQKRQSAENVNQQVINYDAHTKIDILHDLLIKPECTRTIIFLRTRRAVDKLFKALAERGFKVAAIHGDKTQAQRNKALQLFKEGKVNILLATDVVARGIDIENVSHVINYDLPQTHEDYIHRIGRTGRADKVGQAITFVESTK